MGAAEGEGDDAFEEGEIRDEENDEGGENAERGEGDKGGEGGQEEEATTNEEEDGRSPVHFMKYSEENGTPAPSVDGEGAGGAYSQSHASDEHNAGGGSGHDGGEKPGSNSRNEYKVFVGGIPWNFGANSPPPPFPPRWGLMPEGI